MKKCAIRLLFVICLICIMLICIVSCKDQNFTVTFIVDGKEQCSVSTNEQRLPQQPNKKGYTFDGWYWDDDTWQRPFTEQSFSEVDDDINIYAKFSPILSTVTFDSNGGSNVEPISGVAYNTTVHKPVNPTLKDKVFLGWYADDKFEKRWLFDSDIITSNITLYAKWGIPSDLIYELNPDGESYAVVGVNTKDTDIVIPSIYNDKPVTVISFGGNYGAYDITSVHIPDSVEKIDSNAFYACFYLKEVYIPSSVTEIGDSVFAGCFLLNSITVDKANTVYHSDGNCIIETESKTLIVGCSSSVIPDDGSVTNIKGAFYSSLIASIQIPNTVTEIGSCAFNSSAITYITIPESVISIADDAFTGCAWLIEVCNKSQLDIVKGADTFGGVAKYAKNVYTPTSGSSNITVTDDGLVFYDDESGAALLRCVSNAEEIVMPQDFNGKEYSFDHLTFGLCDNLQTITIPNFVDDISFLHFPDYGAWAAKYNRNIIVRDTHPLYTSDNGVLYNKDKTEIISVYCGIDELIVPNGVTKVNFNHSKLTNVTLPDNMMTINVGTFWGCSSLTSVTIPSSVISMGANAFTNCSKLETIKFTGTTAQWNSITKGSDWKGNVPATKVICSDGEVAI